MFDHLRGLFPRALHHPPLVASGYCRCACHDSVEGDVQDVAQRTGAALAPLRAAGGLGTIAVAVTRVDEAAVACDRCRDGHCPALSGRPPELSAPLSGRRWNPPTLVAAEPTAAQADGGGDGEG
jgi:hypothetical protein